jgi:hypothetical protein
MGISRSKMVRTVEGTPSRNALSRAFPGKSGMKQGIDRSFSGVMRHNTRFNDLPRGMDSGRIVDGS